MELEDSKVTRMEIWIRVNNYKLKMPEVKAVEIAEQLIAVKEASTEISFIRSRVEYPVSCIFQKRN